MDLTFLWTGDSLNVYDEPDHILISIHHDLNRDPTHRLKVRVDDTEPVEIHIQVLEKGEEA